MIKVLYIAAWWESINHSIRLFNNIVKSHNDIDVTIIVNTQTIAAKYNATEQANSNINVNILDYQRIIKTDQILTRQYDIVIGTHIEQLHIFNTVNATKKVLMLLDIPIDIIEKEPRRKQQWELVFPYIEKNVDVVIVNTDVAKQVLLEKTAHHNIVVIPYPIKIIDKYVGAHGEEYNKTNRYVVSSCRIVPEKNCSLIPQALQYTDIKKYIAIGRPDGFREDSEFTKVKRLCQQNGIEFEHYHDIPEERKYKLISGAEFLIYPQKTKYIGGLSPWEALITGTQAIVPDYEIHRKLYNNMVLYFYPLSPDVLAEKITKNKDYNIGGDVINYVKKTVSYEAMAEQIASLIYSL